MSRLYEATRAALDMPNDHVVVTAPFFPALTREDANDAIEYAELRSWHVGDTPTYPGPLGESRAVFAANGDGLCPTPQNIYTCRSEGYYMPKHTVYYVS